MANGQQPVSQEDLINQIIQNATAKQSNTATDIGQLLGGAAGGRAQGRATEAEIALRGGQLQNSLYNAALNRAMMQAALPNFRAQQAARGDLLANVQDVGINASPALASHLTTFSGGLRPSALGPNARAAGAALSNIGASNIGRDVLPAVPNMPDMPQANVLDKILGYGGLSASLIGALSKSGLNLNQIGKLFGRGGPGGGGPEGVPETTGLPGGSPGDFGGETGTNEFTPLPGAINEPPALNAWGDEFQMPENWLDEGIG